MSESPPVLTDNLKSPAALARFLLTTIIGLALDLWTKSLAFEKLAAFRYVSDDGVVNFQTHVYSFIPGWLNFEITANHGAVFGIGQGKRWLFVVVSIGAIAFLTYLFAASGRQRLYQILLGMLLAGVLGNMYDRVALGYVRDMIHALPRWPWAFPWIFNVADTLLCTGVGLLIVYQLFLAPHTKKTGPTAAAQSRAEDAETRTSSGDQSRV